MSRVRLPASLGLGLVILVASAARAEQRPSPAAQPSVATPAGTPGDDAHLVEFTSVDRSRAYEITVDGSSWTPANPNRREGSGSCRLVA